MRKKKCSGGRECCGATAARQCPAWARKEPTRMGSLILVWVVWVSLRGWAKRGVRP
ncbi:hypothetical protein AWB69_00938 [Caballeronia udeis]|uniref:Uncharacterized protein n=1 Tax=Caballeronia udeis TaxID=1232866 RepID=A0A158FC00_9BURK|nr:hypothetical protein AWB69_00938 [Caballeronia udeis]